MAGNSTRRTLLAAVGTATLGGLAGCTSAERAQLNPFADPPVSMTVIAASGDETETTCRLDADAVAAIGQLQTPLDRLNDAADGERIETPLTIPTGQAISNLFTRQCDGSVGGLYRYKESWYLIGLIYRDQADHQDHHEQLAESETDNESPTGSDNATATAR